MRWNDNATWSDDCIWDDADTIYLSVSVSVSTPKITETKDTQNQINNSLVTRIMRCGTYTADSTLTAVIPAGTFIDKLIMIESAGHTGQISGGTAASGVQLFSSVGIAGSDSTIIPIAKYFTTATSIFLHHAGSGDDWNSIRLNFYILYWKI